MSFLAEGSGASERLALRRQVKLLILKRKQSMSPEEELNVNAQSSISMVVTEEFVNVAHMAETLSHRKVSRWKRRISNARSS